MTVPHHQVGMMRCSGSERPENTHPYLDNPSVESSPKPGKDKRVILNISGAKYEVPWDTLERFPCSRLGRLRDARTQEELLKLCDYNK
ncbi:hypothetical protein JTE90_019671 [Oedothorax gibbosus]|uniref:Potassium channel tetramerisation-type BTB domain-containing protein n=1 Tax=Oedothorax gibbosus TaxID=931172 RepID=A0AAV6V1H2_9ARAC|nr:hypothetical protein JTE90_019671 [Oedothorax gibbosus]